MALLVVIESKGHLEHLVEERPKLVVCMSPSARKCGTGTGSDYGGQQAQQDKESALVEASPFFEQLARSVDGVVCCRVDSSSHPDIVSGLLLPEHQHGEGAVGESPSACWAFFRSGKMVGYANKRKPNRYLPVTVYY